MPAAFPPHSQSFPAFYLYSLNDSSIPKHISLLNNQRVKIGRQTNAKTVPGERNGYFDSKILSRWHAEVWEESNKIVIKDVKSSNGTCMNGERLSAEGVESEPLKLDDIVDFGIDIVCEDNKTIVHHKIAAYITCIFNVEDALGAEREAYNFQQQQNRQTVARPTDTLNAAAHGRPMLQPQICEHSGPPKLCPLRSSPRLSGQLSHGELSDRGRQRESACFQQLLSCLPFEPLGLFRRDGWPRR
ncbi:SMAD/FHA domain-containing protein [Phellopilus nigrolimitatus]|nr:SMAD/FHA domain-containing protein [Phellopilus nigrolimitatus]